MNQKILVTGSSSGLGKYLLEELAGVPFNRSATDQEIDYHRKQYYNLIIHCAADTRNTVPPTELWNYYQSNIELTRKLTKIPHRLFVFISSPAVYPNPYNLSSETDLPIIPHAISPVHQTYYLYGLCKLLAEQVITKNTERSLILRCVSIVGRTSRSTNIMKILSNDKNPLTLSEESSFNLVSMEQIKRFIVLALSNDIGGTFNAGSTNNATLGEIAKAIGSQPNFGTFIHDVHRVNTTKIRSISKDFEKDSIQIAKETAKQLTCLR